MRYVINLLALVVCVHAKELAGQSSVDKLDEIADKLIDKLVVKLSDRSLQSSTFHNELLDETTLGKPGNLAINPSTNLRSSPGAIAPRANLGSSPSRPQFQCPAMLGRQTQTPNKFRVRQYGRCAKPSTTCSASTLERELESTGAKSQVGNDAFLNQDLMDRALKGTGKKSKSKLKVGIVGAGLAGMVAAMDLLDAGHEVEMFEVRPFVGGKVSSWQDKDGNHIEMGLHVFFGCYYNLFWDHATSWRHRRGRCGRAAP